MVSFHLFVAGRSVDPDHRHYRCLLPHLEACRMADAALSGVGCVRGVSESGGVVAEPVISRFHPIDHEDIDTHRQCKSFFPNSFSIIFLIALISVKVNLIPQLYIANTSFKFSTNSLSSFLCIIIGFSCDKIPHQLPDGEHLRTILFLSHLYSKWLHLRTDLLISRTISKRQPFTSKISIYGSYELSTYFSNCLNFSVLSLSSYFSNPYVLIRHPPSCFSKSIKR